MKKTGKEVLSNSWSFNSQPAAEKRLGHYTFDRHGWSRREERPGVLFAVVERSHGRSTNAPLGRFNFRFGPSGQEMK